METHFLFYVIYLIDNKINANRVAVISNIL